MTEQDAHRLAKMDVLLRCMQADMLRYLDIDQDPASNCGRDWFVSRMIWHLDGAMQRKAQKEGQ